MAFSTQSSTTAPILHIPFNQQNGSATQSDKTFDINYPPSARDKYINEVGEIDFKKGPELDQEALRAFWQVKHRFHQDGKEFEWSMHSLLNSLITAISRSLKGTTFELCQGTHYALGRETWRKFLLEHVEARYVTEDMWGFCSHEPSLYTFWVHLPLENPSPELMTRMQELILLFLAMQSQSSSFSVAEALDYYDALEDHPELAETILCIRKHALANNQYFQIETSSGQTIQFLFSHLTPQAVFRCDDFRLKLNSHKGVLSSELIIPQPFSEALNDLFLHRLKFDSWNNPKIYGNYWAHLTCSGHVFCGHEIERYMGSLLLTATPEFLTEALESGQRRLPNSQDAYLAYQLNVHRFLKQYHIGMTPRSNIGEKATVTPLGSFLYTHRNELSALMPSLRYVSALISRIEHQPTNAPLCRRVPDADHIEISWSGFCIQIPMVLEYPKSLTYVSQVLKLLSPSYYNLQGREIPDLIPIDTLLYRALLREGFEEDGLRLLLVLLGGGWKDLDEEDVLDLPFWLAHGLKTGELQLIIERLAPAYERSPYAPFFSNILETIKHTEEPNEKKYFLICMKVLSQFRNPKIQGAAWRGFWQECSADEGIAFLSSIVSHLDEALLPLAIAKACETKYVNGELLINYLKRIEAYPVLMEVYGSKIRSIPETMIQDLKMSSTEDFWSKLLETQSTLRKLNVFDRYVEVIDKIFEERVDVLFSKREGFIEIWSRIASRLTEQGDLMHLAAFLTKFKVLKSDNHMHPFFAGALRLWIDSGERLEIGLSLISNAEVLEHLDRGMLLKVLNVFMRFPYHADVHNLINHLKPTKEEAPHLLSYVLSYLEEPIEPSNLHQRLDHLLKYLPRFVSQKDTRICPYLVDLAHFMKNLPPTESAWNKFVSLVELTKNEPFFLETYLNILEILSNQVHKASFPLYEKPLSKTRKKLTDSQYDRFVTIYQKLVQQKWHKAFPVEWLLGMLKKENSWEEYAQVYFSKERKNQNNGEVLWILNHALAVGNIRFHDECIQFVSGASLKSLPSEWKRPLAGLIALQPNHSSSAKLFQHLINLADPIERIFFEECRHSRSYERMKTYHATGQISQPTPPTPHEKLSSMLSEGGLSHGRIKEALELLRSLPEVNGELWAKFFTFLSEKVPLETVEKAWRVWLEKKPYSIHVNVWLLGIEHCLGQHQEMFPHLCDFFVSDIAVLFEQNEEEEQQLLIEGCVDNAISLCWRWPQSREAIMQALERGVLTPSTLALPEFWNKMFDMETTVRTSLLLSRSDKVESRMHADHFFITQIGKVAEHELGGVDNQLLFDSFCDFPYVPVSPSHQITLFSWCCKSWTALRRTLDFLQVGTLIKTLCHFEHTIESEPLKATYTPEPILEMFEMYAMGVWSYQLSLKEIKEKKLQVLKETPTKIDEINFVYGVATTLLAVVSNIEKIEERMAYHTTLGVTVQKYSALLLASNPNFIRFNLRWALSALNCLEKINKESIELSRVILQVLSTTLPYVTSPTDDAYTMLARLNRAFSGLIALGTKNSRIKSLSIIVISEIFKLPWLSSVPPREGHSWPALLKALTFGIEKCEASGRKEVAKDVMSIFKISTNEEILKEFQHPESLIGQTVPVFALAFLTLPELEVLELSDWNALFEKVPPIVIKGLIKVLLMGVPSGDINVVNRQSLGLSRVVRYARSAETVQNELTGEFFVKPRPFNPDQDAIAQLDLYQAWIIALISLKQKMPLNPELATRMEELIEIYTQAIISKIVDEATYKLYIPYLVKIMSDMDAFIKMADVFLRTPKPAILEQFSSFIAMKIRKETQALSSLPEEMK